MAGRVAANHISLAGLARARAAQGRTADAIAGYEKAVAVSPQPDYLAALGDLYSLAGDQARARDQYAAVEAIATLAAANRQLYDRQLALFYADHDQKTADAVAIAKASLDRRADVYGYDAYAWALLKDGAAADARVNEERALAIGTPDARLWYHAGMISMALGDVDRARSELRRSLDISPNFDALQASRARTALATLVAAR